MNIFILDHVGQAVRTEHVIVPFLDRFLMDLDLDVGLDP